MPVWKVVMATQLDDTFIRRALTRASGVPWRCGSATIVGIVVSASPLSIVC